MGIFNFNVMERFVERFETKKIVVTKNLERLVECYGFRVFDNGYVAFADENEVKVFDAGIGILLVDKGLFDVFYFKTGESVRKYNGETCWGFYDKQGNLIIKAKKVKILSEKLLAVLNSNGEWKVFLLFEDLVPFLLFYSTRDCVLDVKAISINRTRVNVVFVSPEEVEIQTVNLLSYKSSVSIGARSYKKLFNDMYAISCSGVLEEVVKSENFLEVKSKNNELFDILGDDLCLKYKDVESIISLKNGHYFLCTKGECKLFSTSGQEIGHFRKVKVFDNGEIYASFDEERVLSLVGRFVDVNVVFCVDKKVIISDGNKIRVAEKNDVMDFVFMM